MVVPFCQGAGCILTGHTRGVHAVERSRSAEWSGRSGRSGAKRSQAEPQAERSGAKRRGGEERSQGEEIPERRRGARRRPAAVPIDKLDEQASATLFNADGPVILDLDDFAQGKPRALVAKGVASTSTSTAPSTTIASTTAPSPLPSVTEEDPLAGDSKVVVLFDGGDTEENDLLSGVYIGDFAEDVAPYLKKVCNENQLNFNNISMHAVEARSSRFIQNPFMIHLEKRRSMPQNMLAEIIHQYHTQY